MKMINNEKWILLGNSHNKKGYWYSGNPNNYSIWDDDSHSKTLCYGKELSEIYRYMNLMWIKIEDIVDEFDSMYYFIYISIFIIYFMKIDNVFFLQIYTKSI